MPQGYKTGLPSEYYQGDETTTATGGTSYQPAQTAGLPAPTDLTGEAPPQNPTYPVAPAYAAPPPAQNPTWVFAVNLPSTYPDYAAMKASGSGLVVVADDPNADALINGARQWGIPVSIQVNAPNGITPEQYAAQVAAAKQRWNPDKLVLDIEAVGKGYQGSDGWNWSTQAAALLQPVIGGTSTAITMPPTQDDYNYAAYKGLGGNTEYWVQSYLGDMTAVDPTASRQTLIDNGVDPNSITVITGPTSAPPPSGIKWASYGLATNTPSAGVYGTQGPAQGQYIPGTPSTYGVTPGGQALAGAYGAVPQPGAPAGQTPGAPGTAPAVTPVNWADTYFSGLGLPPDVAAQINTIFTKYADVNEATAVALSYIRGTPWYAQTYPGIQYGIQHGIIANESDYRQYVTAIDTQAQRYLGRHISGDEITGYLTQGISPGVVGQQYAGQANIQAFGGDYKYALGAFGEGQPSDTELTALGQEKAGLDSAIGQRMQRALDQANQRLSSIFQGTSATPSLSTTGGLSAPSLLGQRQKPDVAT